MSSKQSLNVCGGCMIPIEREQYLSCYFCVKAYDLICANVPEVTYSAMSAEQKEKWICVECKCKQPRGDNSNTPARSTRLEKDDSVYERSFIDHQNNRIYCDDQNMNVTIRKIQPSQNQKSTEQLYDEYMHPDETYFDNLRTMIREEFEHVINQRLTNIISNIVTKQVTTIFDNGITKLNDRIIRLESQLKRMTYDSVSNNMSDSMQSSNKLCTTTDVHKSDTPTPISANKPQQSHILATSILSVPDQSKNATKPHKMSQKISTSHTSTLDTSCMTTLKQSGEKASMPQSGLQSTICLNACAVSTQDQHADNCNQDASVLDGEWIEVTKKKTRKRSPGNNHIIRGTATPGHMQLEASERSRYLHLYYVKVGTTDEQVRNHLKSICNSDRYTVESLKARGNYASFKLSVPSGLVESLLNPKYWPEDICIKPWRQTFRKKTFQEQETV